MSGIIIWDDKYSIGIAKIDDQHQKMFEFMNFYYDSISKGKTVESTKITLDNLVDYAVYHFSDEEELMSTIVEADFSAHFEEHKYFISKVAEFRTKLLSGNKIVYELFDFMKEWLLNHILISDQKIGLFIHNKDTHK